MPSDARHLPPRTLVARGALSWPWLRGRLTAWDAAASDLDDRPVSVSGSGASDARDARDARDVGDVQEPPDAPLRLAVAVPSGAAVATVTPSLAGPSPAGATLILRLDRDDGPPLTAADADAAEAVLRHAWGLDDDLDSFDAAAEGDPPFAPLARALRGARVVRHASATEALAWTLIRQRTPHRFARASLLRVRDALGPQARAFGRTWTAFPDAATLASDAARPALLAATNNVRKVERLHAAAGTLADLELDWLRSAPLQEVHRALGGAHGVGTWTVDYVTLLGVGRLEHVPWSDTGLAQAAADVYAGGLRLDPGTLRTLAARYDPLAGVWAHWLKRARHGWRGY